MASSSLSAQPDPSSSVGGIRASLYNATTLEQAQLLASFMQDFQKAHA